MIERNDLCAILTVGDVKKLTKYAVYKVIRRAANDKRREPLERKEAAEALILISDLKGAIRRCEGEQ